jgi:prepilin-type N-terminal cleavage/methylation domain-containing protein
MRRYSPERGMTLVELMIVVAIIGILASVAAFSYTRYMRKSRASEVNMMFSELAAKEEAYHTEFGTYLDTATFNPAVTNGQAQTIDTSTTWATLRIQPSKNAWYCQYRVVAGTGATVPSDYADLYPSAPTGNWYFLLAQCDFDGDGIFSTYLQRGDRSELIKENEGE